MRRKNGVVNHPSAFRVEHPGCRTLGRGSDYFGSADRAQESAEIEELDIRAGTSY